MPIIVNVDVMLARRKMRLNPRRPQYPAPAESKDVSSLQNSFLPALALSSLLFLCRWCNNPFMRRYMAAAL